MNTVFVLVILFFTPNGALQGGSAMFQTERACEAGREQAVKDFAPTKITTSCIQVEAPGEQRELTKPKKLGRDA